MKPSVMSAAVVASLTLAGAAHAQPAPGPNWYVRGDAGASLQDEVNSTPKVKGKSGWTADAAVGRSLGPNVRGEAELVYSDADAKLGHSRIKTVAGLFNGYYDFDTGTALRPFVGAGVGLGQVKLDGGAVHDDSSGSPTSCRRGSPIRWTTG